MALIKTITDMRAVIPRLSKLSDTANLPNVDKAGRLYIIPIIGKTLYNDLNTKYNAVPPTLNANEQTLIKHIQLPLAAFSLLDDMGFLQAVITDNGIRTSTTQQMEAAHRWEYKELQEALKNYAMDGMEILIDYLYETKVTWTSWTSSNEYKEIDSFLIKTGSDFSRYYRLFQPLRTYWLLKPMIADVEENYLNSLLGRDMVEWIKTEETILLTDKGGEVDVKKLLKKATAYLSIKHACEHLPVRFSESGFTVLNSASNDSSEEKDGRTRAEDLNTKKHAAGREGDNYLSKAASYLAAMGAGTYGSGWPAAFTTAYNNSPLKPDPNASPYTNGNERRKIFRF